MNPSEEGFDKDLKIKILAGDDERKHQNNSSFKLNLISTTKYNLITFLPKSLLIQFRRIANVYFLIIAILTCMNFSPKNPVTMIGTFAFVLIFTIIKEGYEDIKRYKQDKEQNFKKTKAYNSTTRDFDEKNWQDVKVGDFLLVEKGQNLPADLLLLKSSLDTGMCFVDTMNLDGETNLKEKLCPQGIKDFPKYSLISTKIKIICDKPNEILDKWDCSYYHNNSTKPIICGTKQLLLRGCILQNTQWIIGLTIYTGHDTKILRNAKNPPIKMSNVMIKMNSLLYSVFVFQIIICFIFSINYVVWQKNNGAYTFYLSIYNENFEKVNDSVTTGDLFVKVLTYLVAYSHLIPISLYVALEIVKLIQSMLIYCDYAMIDPSTNKPATARTSDLIEELGQVEFVFSDKTGTLTKNEMEFRKCFINNCVYGNSEGADKNAKNTINGDPEAYKILVSTISENSIKDKILIEQFFIALTICHSAFVENKNGKKEFQSSSPDEVALLKGAEQMGFEFCKRTSETIEVLNYNGVYQIWELLLELPFDSNRKRMSVIVKQKDSKDNNYYLYTKGADIAMLPNMDITKENESMIKANLLKFAQEGLRTLVIAKKPMTDFEVKDILNKYNKICSSLDKEKEKYLSGLFEDIEKGLNYLGSTGIEDKLQDGVPETIECLMNADIRVWVLTGDKKETAIEIGKSCKLILDESIMDSINLASESEKDDNPEELQEKLNRFYHKFVLLSDNGDEEYSNSNRMKSYPPIFSKLQKNNHGRAHKKLYIIIDGHNLAHVLADPDLSAKFFKIGLIANSVICCRVSPKQKSQVVLLVKNSGNWITLSIGDGANDVPMIMEAHIGIGINGKEGTQAVRSSDYAIGQFRFLKRMLLIHGRWGYRRISIFICYYFYKNIVTVFTEFYFSIFNGFSGQIYFPDLLPLCNNAFWTSWPCIFAYSIEKDVEEKLTFENPKLYKAGQQKYYFSMKKFWIWILFAFIHGLMVFFFISYGFNSSSKDSGQYPDHWTKSSLSFSIIINIVTLKIFIDSMYWNKLNIIIAVSSLLFYYFCIIIFCVPNISFILQNELMQKFKELTSNYKTCISLIIIPLIALTPDITYKFIQTLMWPSPVEYILQQKNLKRIDNEQVIRRGNEDSKDIILSNGVYNGNNREYTVSPETQKKMLNFENRNYELKFHNTRSGIDNTRNEKSYGRDYMVENILMQRMQPE